MDWRSSGEQLLDRFRQATSGARPPLEGAYVYVFCAILAYCVSDLGISYIRPQMLPSGAPPQPTQKRQTSRPGLKDYSRVVQRNIFDQDGKIPPPLSSGDKPAGETDGPAVKTSLQVKLLGTIVHINPKLSVATMSLPGKNKTQSVKVGETIPGLMRIRKIERRKVTFLNVNLGRMEYIDIPEDLKLALAVSGSPNKAGPRGKTEVAKQGEFDFSLKRSTLEKYTSNLSSILKDAKVRPNIRPGSGGKVEGFRFDMIKPDSIYVQLGFKEGDVIKAVDGEPVNSPTKAMELYNAMKTSQRVNITVERDGRDEEFNYNIE